MQTVIQKVLTNYVVLGQDKPKTILILHGWGQSLENWRTVAEKLSFKYRVFLLDLPGFGTSSSSSTAFDTQKYSEFVNEFIKKLNLNHLTLIGHSFGGKISIKIASENSRVDNLFLISPSGIKNKSIGVILKTILFKIIKFIFFWISPCIKEKYIQIFGSRDYKSAGTMRTTFKRVIADKIDTDAMAINIPTVIIWGENDSELGLNNAKILKSLIKGSTLRVLWGLGHSPNIESPKKLTNLLLEYL